MPHLEAPHTTSASIALSNLSGTIAYKTKHLSDPAVSAGLVDALMSRAQFIGSVADLDEADALVTRALLASPADPRAHLAKASVLGALHQFANALFEIERGSALGASANEVARARLPVALALGRCDEALKSVDAADDALPLDMAVHAAVDQRSGRAGESERLFERARTRYRDVSPFAFAWMDFERGRALERQGDSARAGQYYAEASQLLPTYAHAVVHLAAMASPARALELLAGLDAACDDPDALAARADALRRSGRPAEAAEALAAAKSRFEVLLAKHPEAFADHGAAFFLGIGNDLPRALSLAKMAAANAPSEEALDLWLTIASALGRHEEACAAVARSTANKCALGPAVAARFEVARRSCTP